MALNHNPSKMLLNQNVNRQSTIGRNLKEIFNTLGYMTDKTLTTVEVEQEARHIFVINFSTSVRFILCDHLFKQHIRYHSWNQVLNITQLKILLVPLLIGTYLPIFSLSCILSHHLCLECLYSKLTYFFPSVLLYIN